MTGTAWRQRPALRITCLYAGLTPVTLVVAGLISVHMKQDDNWNLQTYHMSNVFSLLTVD